MNWRITGSTQEQSNPSYSPSARPSIYLSPPPLLRRIAHGFGRQEARVLGNIGEGAPVDDVAAPVEEGRAGAEAGPVAQGVPAALHPVHDVQVAHFVAASAAVQGEQGSVFGLRGGWVGRGGKRLGIGGGGVGEREGEGVREKERSKR